MNNSDFASKVNKLLENTSGEISVLCHDFAMTEPLASVNPEAVMVSASIIKVPIMFYALDQIMKGTHKLDEMVNVVKAVILDDSVSFESGPRQASLQELLTWMIIYSDNTSTNSLLDIFGFDAVTGYCMSKGLNQTRLERKMLDFKAIDEGRNNYTSARDMYLLYKMFFDGGLLDEPRSAVAADILRGQRDKHRLARYVWEQDIVIAHKTGGLDYLSHDTGVFMHNGRKVFGGVFVQKADDIDGNPRLIGEIGKLIASYIKS